MLTGTDYIDLSDLWREAHSHLRPLPDAIACLPVSQKNSCLVCGAKHSVLLVAEVTFNNRIEPLRLQIDFCHRCGHVILPLARLDGFLLESAALRITPVAVNARLWSRQPTFLNIEPTNRCNFSCWYCVGRHLKQADISVDNFKKALANCPEIKAIALVGEGEPLLHNDFCQMAKEAIQGGIKIFLSTNGSTLNSVNVRNLCESGVHYLSVSIDSHEPSFFASSRRGGNLEQVLAGVRRLVDYRDRNGFRYPRIGLKGTLFSSTCDQLPAIAALAREHGFEFFEGMQRLNAMRTYLPIYPKDKLDELAYVDRVAAAIERDRDVAHRFLRPVAEFCTEEGIAAGNVGRPNGLRPNCDEEWIYSLWSGDITPCCQIKEIIDPEWNLFNTSLSLIISNHHYENIRFNLWNGFFLPICRGCWKIACNDSGGGEMR